MVAKIQLIVSTLGLGLLRVTCVHFRVLIARTAPDWILTRHSEVEVGAKKSRLDMEARVRTTNGQQQTHSSRLTAKSDTVGVDA